MLVKICFAVITLATVVPASCWSDEPASFQIRFLVPRAEGAVEVDVNKRQTIEIKNTTDRELRIWHPDSKAGSGHIRFQFTNSRTGETTLVQRGLIPPRGRWDVEEFEVVTIPVGQTYRWTLEFDETEYSEFLWTRYPLPNSADSFLLRTQFESPKTASGDEQGVWHGEIRSEPIAIRLISKLDTVEHFIATGFPDKAIELMLAHPELIKEKDTERSEPLEMAARFGNERLTQWLFEHGANAIASDKERTLYFDSPDKIRTFIKYWPELITRHCGMGTQLLEAARESVLAKDAVERDKWRKLVDACRTAGADYDLLTAITLDDIAQVKTILRKWPQLADRFRVNKHWNDYEGDCKTSYGSKYKFKERDRDEVSTISPLRIAARFGRLEICRYLIDQHHVDVNDFQRGWGLPIIKDALLHPDVVQLLIDHSADFKIRFVNKSLTLSHIPSEWIGNDATLLHYAARDGHPASIKILIDAGIDLTESTKGDPRGEPLQLDGEVFDRVPSSPPVEETALDIAATCGLAENAIAILRHDRFQKLDKSRRKQMLDRCLMTAIRHDFGMYSDTPSEPDRPKLVAALLQHGADPNVKRDGHSVIQYAAKNVETYDRDGRHRKQVRRILEMLRDTGAQGDVFSAVAMNDEKLVTRLLQENPQSANARGPDKTPALHLAVGNNNVNIVKKLLQAGCDVDIVRDVGGTALSIAAYWNRLAIANELLAASAEVNSKSGQGATPLHSAVQEGHLEMIRLLLDHGADVNVLTPKGQQDLLEWLKGFRISDGSFYEIQTAIEEAQRGKEK